MRNNYKFERYEFKYVLSPAMRINIEKEISHFMQLDPFALQLPNRKYFIRSLYFDDDHFTAYHDKNDGLLKRSKFRLRTYTNYLIENTDVYLEIKGRYDARVLKYRTKISDQIINIDLSKKISPKELATCLNSSNKISAQFTYETYRKQLKPVMLVDYFRRPLVSKFDRNFRITFDDTISAKPTEFLFLDREIFKTREILKDRTVMEVKFLTKIPVWFRNIIKKYELNRVSYSKICKSLEYFKLVDQL